METKEEIPCSMCKLWHSEKKEFSCEPQKCDKLTEWLLKYGPSEEKSNQVIQYIV